MGSKKETVCAVVVTYNRKALLLECLEALRKQTRPVQGIYLIDNASTDGTPGLLLEKGYIKESPPENLTEPWEKEFEIKNLTDGQIMKLYYVRMHENTGGAGGFHEGMKRAYEKGYDWLWLMDDDVEPREDALFNLLKYGEISWFIHPLRIDECFGKEIHWEGYLDVFTGWRVNCGNISFAHGKKFAVVNVGCFEGALINRLVVDFIGLPEKVYFIVYDDTVYGFKSSFFTNVLFVKEAIFIKKRGEGKNSELYLYYSLRNLFLLKRDLDHIFPRYKQVRSIFFFFQLLWYCFNVFKVCKFKALIIITKAIKDGICLRS